MRFGAIADRSSGNVMENTANPAEDMTMAVNPIQVGSPRNASLVLSDRLL